MIINAFSGVMDPYVMRIFHEELAAKDMVMVKNCQILEILGGHHPDPNMTYAHELVEDMANSDYELGAAFDGDAVSEINFYGKEKKSDFLMIRIEI